MNFRGLTSPTCKNLVFRPYCTKRRIAQQSWRHQSVLQPLAICSAGVQLRGKKTTTKVKVKDLPQGALPSLLPDASIEPPEQSYPHVLQQHLNNVHKHSDCVVLTRVGDFYELYFDQVAQYAPLLNLKQAKRATKLGDVAMAGFQQTQLSRYLKVLVEDHGLQVAIAEQVLPTIAEDSSNGIDRKFDRKVTRVLTPGTLIDEDFMDTGESNYLLAVHIDGALPQASRDHSKGDEAQRYLRNTKVGLSWVDLSNGEFYTQAGDLAGLPGLVARVKPTEVVFHSDMEHTQHNHLLKFLGDSIPSVHFHESPKNGVPSIETWTPMLERAVPEKEHSKFTPVELIAGSLVLDYVRSKIFDAEIQLQLPVRRSDDEFMAIDKQSLRGLEIRTTLRDGAFEGSLLHATRQTVTKSGARLLSQRLVAPLTSLSAINNRLDLVEQMMAEESLREDIVALLRGTSDTRRLLQRFSINKGDADDLLSLAATIKAMVKTAEILHEHILSRQDPDADMACLWDLLGRLELEEPNKIAKSIYQAIDEEGLSLQHSVEDEERADAEEMASKAEDADASGEKPPKLTKRTVSTTMANRRSEDIWIMRRSASKTLEVTHSDLSKLAESKLALLLNLRKALKSESLTFKWSAQLGHHCHVKSRTADISQLPGSRLIVKAKTNSTQAFYLASWTDLGVKIDDAKLRIREEEERVFDKLRAQVIKSLMRLRRNASVLDELDVACSSATVAKARNLIRPVLNEGTAHKIFGGRHPTVHVGLQQSGRQFISNDCSVGSQDASVYLITGPNMGGKSTYLRQNALITILAQTGCFVPADYAEIGIVDKIFSRVGSADNLYQDQSTFMVEMLETAEILKSATQRSFVIMDEVGRGTTPEDGVAVGYAAIHHLHNINKSRTLFATHFHALADMTKHFDGVECWCTDIESGSEGDNDGSWSYVHKLRKGVNRESHALKVARLAEMPEEAAKVAAEVLQHLR